MREVAAGLTVLFLLFLVPAPATCAFARPGFVSGRGAFAGVPEGRQHEGSMRSSRARLLPRPERVRRAQESPRQLRRQPHRPREVAVIGTMALPPLAGAGQPSPGGDGAAAAIPPAATASSRFRAFEILLQKW